MSSPHLGAASPLPLPPPLSTSCQRPPILLCLTAHPGLPLGFRRQNEDKKGAEGPAHPTPLTMLGLLCSSQAPSATRTTPCAIGSLHVQFWSLSALPS